MREMPYASVDRREPPPPSDTLDRPVRRGPPVGGVPMFGQVGGLCFTMQLFFFQTAAYSMNSLILHCVLIFQLISCILFYAETVKNSLSHQFREFHNDGIL